MDDDGDGFYDDRNEYEDDDNDDEEEFSPTNFDFLKPPLHISGDTPGLTCEIKLYEARYNQYSNRKALQVGKHYDQKPDLDPDHTSALVYTRFYKMNRELDFTELTIRSPYLKQMLGEVIKEYPGINFKTGNIIIKDLPKCLFHYRDELQSYGLNLDVNSDAFKHLLILLRHMWDQLQVQYISYNNLMESDLIAPGLEFSNLWMAFRPGDYLYLKSRNCHRIVILKRTARGEKGLKISFVYIADDGTQVGYVKDECEIEPYDGYRPLVNLEIFPLQYHPEQESVKEHAIARGQKSMNLRGPNYRMYHGQTRTLSKNRRTTFVGQMDVYPLQSTITKSRIMIDAKTFAQKNWNNMPYSDETQGRLPKLEGTETYNFKDEHYMICDHEVPGFSLVDKRWCWFDVDKIVDVEFNYTAFKSLLLPQEQKDMIQSLVEVHTNSNLLFDDIIKGKGKGMVFLLHGVPGVGKTLTAEGIADKTSRPLYTISSGELGVEPSLVEMNLKAALDLATTWNAIVLIDEADIFLEQRSMHDIERNSLVSIFLRLMEYYEGILILTTNRIQSFDEAFKSRIHLAIKYHALSPSYRASLWKSFIISTLNPAQSSEAQYWYPWLTDAYLDEMGKEELNGRQIKNTVRTAYALSVSAKLLLSPQDIETALKAMRMFEFDFAESFEGAEEHSNKRRRRN
ncbi:P-loop containing nucleoside triphosphate hydrolase protein [Halenospora varia]|nr:P-loop containing nucleoside triphosphate hydrolase protein [Halenospora varia]